MRLAAGFGDGWNGWLPTDPTGNGARELLRLLEEACDRVGRDPTTIDRTGDLFVDPLDLQGARARSIETLARLDDLGFDEVRCYALSAGTAAARLDAVGAFAELVRDV